MVSSKAIYIRTFFFLVAHKNYLFISHKDYHILTEEDDEGIRIRNIEQRERERETGKNNLFHTYLISWQMNYLKIMIINK